MSWLHVLSWRGRQKFCQHASNGLPKLHHVISWRTGIKIKLSSQPLVKSHNTNFTRICSWFMTDMRREMTSLKGTDCMRMHEHTTVRKALLLKLRAARPELPCLYITQTLITDRRAHDKGLSWAESCQHRYKKCTAT